MIILFFVGKKFKDKGKILSLIFISLICFLAVVFSDKVFSYDVLSAVAGKQNDFISSSQLGEGVGSNFELTRLEPNLKSFMKIIPEGLANSFFRPFFNEINSVFLLLAFLEVLFLVFTFIISIVFFKKPEANKLLFVLFSLGFVIYLFVLIGVITPNSGAIVRYRSIGLPFLYAMLFCFWDLKRIKKLLLKSLNKIN